MQFHNSTQKLFANKSTRLGNVHCTHAVDWCECISIEWHFQLKTVRVSVDFREENVENFCVHDAAWWERMCTEKISNVVCAWWMMNIEMKRIHPCVPYAFEYGKFLDFIYLFIVFEPESATNSSLSMREHFIKITCMSYDAHKYRWGFVGKAIPSASTF